MTVPTDSTTGGDLRQLLADVVRELPGPLRRVRVDLEGGSVEVEWAAPRQDVRVAGQLGPPAPAEAGTGSQAPGPSEAARTSAHVVRAPMVGTFHVAPEPGAPPYVAVGDAVVPSQTVAVMEAMKLMNPIQAEVAGTVVEVLVADGISVEYDQPLLVISPADG